VTIADPRIASFLSLGKGWDSYGGEPIDPKVAERADELLRLTAAPGQACPMANGGITLEWHLGDREFAVTLDPNGEWGVFYSGDHGEWERETGP